MQLQAREYLKIVEETRENADLWAMWTGSFKNFSGDYGKSQTYSAQSNSEEAKELRNRVDELLKDNDALGDYTSIVSYEEDLGNIKSIIDQDKTPTVTFTCRKLLTGTNIPAWGSLIFLRPILIHI